MQLTFSDCVFLICQGMPWQHLHQPCVAGKVQFSLSLSLSLYSPPGWIRLWSPDVSVCLVFCVLLRLASIQSQAGGPAVSFCFIFYVLLQPACLHLLSPRWLHQGEREIESKYQMCHSASIPKRCCGRPVLHPY